MRALKDIRIGTMIKASMDKPGPHVSRLVELGFESIEPFFWQVMDKDLKKLAHELKGAIGDADVVVDTLGMFGNPLEEGELDRKTLAGWEALIDNAHLFGAKTIAGFTGRIRGKPLEESIPRFKSVWGKLAKRAADKGLRLAFENCAMDGNWQSGDWNIAHNPDAWELMFNALPDDNLGLEWEPCHQLVYLIDPIPQIRKWAPKFFHMHGKDATVRWDVIKEHGIFGKYPFVQMRTPGFGDSDWTRIISELRLAGFKGAIDIEGWHDPVYREELELTGQVHALNHLNACLGGVQLIADQA
jgi:sugar phosphate isomerase/epimerase